MCSRAALALALLALAGCGSDSGTAKPTSTRLVTPGKPPLVNSFDIDPADGSFLLTTNKGFYRVTKDGKKVTRVPSSVTATGKTSRVGTFLTVSATAEKDTLLGSGHPDEKAPGLPQFLGFLESGDDGKTWKVVSRLGLADLHVMRQQFGRLYGYDAVIGALLVSQDGGRNWTEHPMPRELITDFVIDPEDEDYILATSEKTLFRSTDGGDSWRPLGPVNGLRLAWPSKKVLISTDASGRVQQSSDRGESWQDVGRIDGEPWRLKAVDDKTLYAALSDGTIVKSTDGGGEWSVLFSP